MIVNHLNKVNFLVNKGMDLVSEQNILPTIKATYQTAADLSIAITGIFSKTLSTFVENRFYDPLTTSQIYFISKSVEIVTLFFAKKKPVEVFSLAHYLDRSFISMNQHLHAYTMRINDLVQVPQNLKSFLRDFSFETVVNHIGNTTPRFLFWLNRAVIHLKRFALAVLEVAVRIMDLWFKTIFLGVEFGLFSYLIEIIEFAQSHLQDHIVKAALEATNNKETALRKSIVTNAVEGTIDYLVPVITNVAAKSLLGLIVYLPTKNLLNNYLHTPEWAIHTLGISIISTILWKNVVVHSCDPYYESFDPSFESERLSFIELCDYFDIRQFWLVTALAGNIFGRAPAEIPPKKKWKILDIL